MPGEEIQLNEKDRAKLDGIVQKMASNGEKDEDIQFVVNDFKQKYGLKKKESIQSPSLSADGISDSANGGSVPSTFKDLLSGQIGGKQPLLPDVSLNQNYTTPPAQKQPTITTKDGAPYISDMGTQPSAPQNSPQLKAVSSPLETTAKDVTNYDPNIAQKESLNPLMAGTAMLASGVSKTPSLLWDMYSSASNALNKAIGNVDPTATVPSSSEISKDTGIHNVIGEDLDVALTNYNNEKARRFDKSMKEYFSSGKEGDFGKGLEYVATNVAEAIPTTIAIALSGGTIGTLPTFAGGSLVFGAQKKSELDQNNPNLSEGEKVGIALTSGLMESASESLFGAVRYIGAPIKSIFVKEGKDAAIAAAKEAIKDSYGKAFARYFGSQAEEIITEVANQYGQNVLDKYSGVDPNRDLTQGLFESAVTAAAMAGTVGSPVLAGQLAATSKKSKEKAQEILNQKQALENDMASPDITPEAKQHISNKLKDLNEEEYNITNEAKKKYDALPPEQKTAVDQINQKINSISNALNDPNISDESRMYLEQDVETAHKQIEDIYSSAKPASEIKTEAQQQPVTTEQKLTQDEQDELDTLKAINESNPEYLSQEEKSRIQELEQKQSVSQEQTTNSSQEQVGYFEQKAKEENRSLPEDQKAIETKFAKDLDQNYEQRKAEYLAKNGNVFDTDKARELSPDYNNDPTLSQAVHVPAREFVTRVYKEELAKPAPEGKQNVVTFTSGGSGAGKTMAVKAAEHDSQLVVDTNLSRFEDAKKDIQEALDAGKQVRIDFVYRDPKSAFIDGVMGGKHRGGRTVPLGVAMSANQGSLETIKQLADFYKDNPDVSIQYFNNSKKGSPMQPLSLEDVKKIQNDYEQVKKEVQDEIDRQYQSGQINERQYKGFSGRTEATFKKNDAGGVQEVERGDNEKNVGQSGQGTQKTGVSVGITPFADNRIPKYEKLNRDLQEAKQSGDKKTQNAIIKQMANDIRERLERIIPSEKFKIIPAEGVWDGGSEPSFYIEFSSENDDIFAALAKVAEEFDQDEVHIRSNDVSEEDDFLSVQDNGSFVTPYALFEFNEKVDFNKLISEAGFGGATVLGDNKVMVYNSELPSENGKQISDILNDFNNKVKKLKDESKGSIASTTEGATRLRRYSRNERGEGTRTYQQAISNLRTSEETKQRIESNPEQTKVGVWANSILSRAQRMVIASLDALNPKIGKIEKVGDKYERQGGDKKTVEKLTSIGEAFDKMAMSNKSKTVMDAYKSLAKVVDMQYSALPIKVKPNSVAIKLPDGKIIWQDNYTEPYANSKEAIADIENNNQFTFFATNPKTFGSTDVDYTGHPMLEKSPFKSAAVPVYNVKVDEKGNPVTNEDGTYVIADIIPGETTQYDMLYNDAFRVVHDYYAHGSTGSQFGPRGEDIAWAAHVATILKEKNLTEQDKIRAIWALTTETRGQNTWVNFINERNKMVTYELDRARKLEKEGKLEEADKIRKQFVYPNGIQFADQKIGLLPKEALIQGYTENFQNDKDLNKLFNNNPELVKKLEGEYKTETPKKQDKNAVTERNITKSDQQQHQKGDARGKTTETSDSNRIVESGKKQTEQQQKEVAKEEPVTKKPASLENEMKAIEEEEAAGETVSEEDEATKTKLFNDVKAMQAQGANVAELKFKGILERAYKAKADKKIKRTTYTEIKNKIKDIYGGKAVNKEDAKIRVSGMIQEVKDKLLGQGYKNITLGTILPVTPKNIADLLDLTEKLIHKGIDAGYGISESMTRAFETIKKVPLYKRLVDNKELNPAEFEKMVDTAISSKLKGTKKEMSNPDITKGTDKRKTTTRLKTDKSFDGILKEMGNDGETYDVLNLKKADKHVRNVVKEFERNGLLEDLAVEIAAGRNPFYQGIKEYASFHVADRLRALAEKEGNSMQKSALTKLAAEVMAQRAKNVTAAGQTIAVEKLVAEQLPLSAEGIKNHVESVMSVVQDTHASEDQKNDAKTAFTDINSLLLDPNVQEAINKAADEKINNIAEATKGKEWVDKVDKTIDDLKIDLEDC